MPCLSSERRCRPPGLVRAARCPRTRPRPIHTQRAKSCLPPSRDRRHAALLDAGRLIAVARAAGRRASGTRRHVGEMGRTEGSDPPPLEATSNSRLPAHKGAKATLQERAEKARVYSRTPSGSRKVFPVPAPPSASTRCSRQPTFFCLEPSRPPSSCVIKLCARIA